MTVPFKHVLLYLALGPSGQSAYFTRAQLSFELACSNRIFDRGARPYVEDEQNHQQLHIAALSEEVRQLCQPQRSSDAQQEHR